MPDLQPGNTTIKHRILLTGATGFIGQHVHRIYLDAGHDVVAVIRPERSVVPIDPRATVLRADLLDPAAMGRALDGITAVVAIAGAVRGSTVDDFRRVNAESIDVLKRVMLEHAPHTPLLLMSSLAASVPTLSEYAASKRAGEDVITSSRLNWCALRPPAVYGPGDKELRPLLAWLARGVIIVPGNPAQRIAFIHVADIAKACIAWLDHHERLHGRIFTIDDGTVGGYDWPAIESAVCRRKLVRIVIPPKLLHRLGVANAWIAERLNKAPMLSPGKVREMMNPRWVGGSETEGNQALAEATGWQPKWTLGPGVREMLKHTH